MAGPVCQSGLVPAPAANLPWARMWKI